MWIVALVVRIAFFICFSSVGDRAWLCYDSQQYHDRALHLIEHKALTPVESSQKAYRLPGYPQFLACCYALEKNSVLFALLVQIVLSSLIPLLVFLLARALFPLLPVLAYIAGWVACLHVGLIIFAGMLATETLAVLLLLLLLLVLLARAPTMVLAGSLLGFLSLLRPVGHYLLVLIALWIWYEWRSLRSVGLFVGGWLIVVLPWLVRNLVLVGGICFHTLPGMHFLQYSAAAVVMQHEQKTYLQARAQLLKAWDNEVDKKALEQGYPVTEYQRCVLGEKLAGGIVLAHPWYACKHALTELIKTLCALHTTQVVIADVGGWPVYTAQTTWAEKIRYNLAPPLKTPWLWPLIYLDVFVTLSILFFSFIGLLALVVRRRLQSRQALCVLMAGLLWGVTIAYGCARLRLPFEPIMIIIGVYGVDQIWLWLQGCKSS